MNVTLRQLQIFLTVARLGSFTEAANELHVTQSALSVAIKQLEAELGLQLLDRTTRRVSLSAVGQVLFTNAPRLVSDLQEALRELKDMGEQKRGRAIVACVPSLTARLLPGFLKSVRKHYPHVNMQIMDVAAADVIKKVAGGEAELGITSGPLEASSLLIEPLFNDRFCVVSAARHDPFEGRTAVGWRELKGRPLIMLSKLTGSRQLIDRALAATETEVQVLQELSLQGSVLPMVEAGIGDSVLPETACPTHDKKFIIRPLIEPAISRPVVMVRKRNRSLAPAASAVWELARSYFPTQAQALFGTTPKTELHIPIAHGGLA